MKLRVPSTAMPCTLSSHPLDPRLAVNMFSRCQGDKFSHIQAHCTSTHSTCNQHMLQGRWQLPLDSDSRGAGSAPHVAGHNRHHPAGSARHPWSACHRRKPSAAPRMTAYMLGFGTCMCLAPHHATGRLQLAFLASLSEGPPCLQAPRAKASHQPCHVCRRLECAPSRRCQQRRRGRRN